MDIQTENCQNCGKPVNKQGSGDLASFMLQSNYCQCHKTLAIVNKTPQNAAEEKIICPRCGLEKTTSQAGSITGYLFQDLRCSCDGDGSLGRMSLGSRFFNIKNADGSPAISQNNNPIPSGTIIGGIYKILRLIGQGGMGEVYLAEHTGLAKQCALKLIPPERVTEVGWQRFQQEARAVSALNHVNLVQVSDLGIHDGCLPFYAMEFVSGKSIADLLVQHGPMPADIAIKYFKQICDGVDHAHRAGIVHRDLKPANIMIVESETQARSRVKILDFGLAKLVRQDRNKQGLTAVGEVFGSPFYMSPEQCLGERVDNRSDIYSLGCTFFECLTGRPPFTGNLPAAIMHGHEEVDAPSLNSINSSKKFSDDLEIVMAKLLRKNPVERYQTCAEFRADLERLERNESVQPFYINRTAQKIDNSIAISSRSPGQAERSPIAWKVAAGIALVILCGGLAALTIKFSPLAKKESAQSLAASKSAFEKRADLDFAKFDDTAGGQLFKENEIGGQLVYKSSFDTNHYCSFRVLYGKNINEFSFPTDLQIGTLEDANGSAPIACKGYVRLPAAMKLAFSPWSDITRGPNYFRRFRSTEFVRLSIQQVMDPNAILRAYTTMPDYQSVPALNLIAAPISSYKDERANKRPMHLNAESLKIVAGLKLKHFYSSPVYISIAELATMPWLSAINIMHLQEYKDITPLLEKMQGSQNLQGLLLGCKVNARDYPLIATFPNLRCFSCGWGIESDEQLKTLAAMPNLQEISLAPMVLNNETVQILRSFKKLKIIAIADGKPYLVKKMTERLKSVLPAISIKSAAISHVE